MKKTFFIECILCALLLFTGITLSFRENKRTAEVGAFGNKARWNNTFEDLSRNLLEEFTS